MNKIINGVKNFKKNIFPRRKEFYKDLMKGQQPEVLFITCADSRIATCFEVPRQENNCEEVGQVQTSHARSFAMSMWQCLDSRASAHKRHVTRGTQATQV